VTVERLGTTGNRISTQVTSECLVCDPDAGPTTELTAETLLMPLAILPADFQGRTIVFTAPDAVTTASFASDGTGSFDDDGTIVPFTWSIGEVLENVLTLRGTGTPGSRLPYIELFLVDGTVLDGTIAALSGEATDGNADGEIDDAEAEASIRYEAVELLTTGPTLR
jgi:hypothetical protein